MKVPSLENVVTVLLPIPPPAASAKATAVPGAVTVKTCPAVPRDV